MEGYFFAGFKVAYGHFESFKNLELASDVNIFNEVRVIEAGSI